MPIGIRVEPILMHDVGYVYLIEVQESVNKPHQYNKQYPIRLDGQSVGAPHYLVEALFRQVKRPELNGYLRVTSYAITLGSGMSPNFFTLTLEVTIINSTPMINDKEVYVMLIGEAGTFTDQDVPGRSYSTDGHKVTLLNTASLITDGLPTVRQFEYVVTTEELRRVEDSTDLIILGFGGASSATKLSKYKVQFTSNHSGFAPSDFGRKITNISTLKRFLNINKEENIISSDGWGGRAKERLDMLLKGI